MQSSLLDQLETMTTVVSDTGDFNSIAEFRPRDATTNPTLLATAAQMPEYRDLVDDALRWAYKSAPAGAPLKVVIDLAIDRLFIEFGLRILKIIPGRVSTEVDARLSFDTRGSIDKGRALINLYEDAGVSRERILIKIASTWEGIRAAEALEKEGIHCNMTLLFGLHQAIACAEAGATLISPFVGRILDWYKKNTGRDYLPPEDPGVLSVTRIYDYFKKFDYGTQVMGASFRNIGEIIELAGCDLLTISPQLLQELKQKSGKLERKLDPEKSKNKDVQKITVDEATFRKMHEADKMSHEKLDEGIQGFSKAIVALEKLLEERYKALAGKAHVGDAARAFFKVYDLDGDGFITREEWGGTAAVFWALDANHDGRISPEEMAAGLGIAFLLEEAK